MIYVFDLLATADDSFKNVCKKSSCCLNFSSRVDVSFSDPFINSSENLLTTAVFRDQSAEGFHESSTAVMTKLCE